MAEGRSLEGCAALLGVHPDSLNEWQKAHPQFSVAVRAGRAAATTYWENRLLAVANGEAGNAQAIQWALRNRSRAASGWHHDAQQGEARAGRERRITGDAVPTAGRVLRKNTVPRPGPLYVLCLAEAMLFAVEQQVSHRHPAVLQPGDHSFRLVGRNNTVLRALEEDHRHGQAVGVMDRRALG